MSNILSTEDAVKFIAIVRKRAVDRLNAFRARISDPERAWDAFSWGGDSVVAAADVWACDLARRIYEARESSVEALVYLRFEVVKRAKYPKRSCSPLANLAEEELTASLARLADELGGGLQ